MNILKLFLIFLAVISGLPVAATDVGGNAELVVAAWEATLPVRALHQGDRIKLGHE